MRVLEAAIRRVLTWLDFDKLDWVIMAGLAMLFFGLYQVYVPAAWIGCGVVLLYFSLLGLRGRR